MGALQDYTEGKAPDNRHPALRADLGTPVPGPTSGDPVKPLAQAFEVPPTER